MQGFGAGGGGCEVILKGHAPPTFALFKVTKHRSHACQIVVYDCNISTSAAVAMHATRIMTKFEFTEWPLSPHTKIERAFGDFALQIDQRCNQHLQVYDG